jgi:hypothetical protein
MDSQIYFISIESSDKGPIQDPAVLLRHDGMCLSERFPLYASGSDYIHIKTTENRCGWIVQK